MRILIAALIMLALPATAQELSDRYEVIGTMAITLDGTEMVLPIAVDHQDKWSFASIRPMYGSEKMLGVSGFTVANNGGWERPIIDLVIQISGANSANLMSIALNEKGRTAATQASSVFGFGSMDLTEFSITEDFAIDLRFSGELIRTLMGDDYEETPEEGQPPVVVSGTVSVVIPEASRNCEMMDYKCY